MRDDLESRYREAWKEQIARSAEDEIAGTEAGWLLIAALVAFLVVLAAWLWPVMARAEQPAANPNCRGFISMTCCCTRGCCFEVEVGKDIVPVDIDGERWRINGTGETRVRTGWSQIPGKSFRCACRALGHDGLWQPDASAPTRCLYPSRAEAGI
jgi:hypothetical protein